MKVVKIIGKKYNVTELEENSKVIRKWLAIKQMKKVEIKGKYHIIEDCNEVNKSFNELMETADNVTKKFYQEYINENWKETVPIMKDVSSYAKIRPDDGVEFCILI